MTKEQISEFTLRTSQSNHSGLILVLFDVERVYVDDAIAAYEAGDMDVYLKNIGLAKRAHNELMSCINPADTLGRQVLLIFRFIYAQLTVSEVKRMPKELDRCSDMMDNLRKGFVRLHELDDDEPVMRNTHQVYAGLTYGKGVLNESVENADYVRRGFTV